MTANQLNLFLPRDILIKILLLLPLESIVVCKLVSKEWNSLIDDPMFFRRYRDTTLGFFSAENTVYCVLIRQARGNSKFTVNRIPIGLTSLRIDQLFSEPSKGIACVCDLDDGRLFILNLFTGASYTITDAPRLHEQQHITSTRTFGFGYDLYADDCKVLLVGKRGVEVDINPVQDNNGPFWVYSLRNHAWKALEGFAYAAYDWIHNLPRHCSLDGVLHWVVATRGTLPKKNVIVTYDLHTCSFGEMSLPTVCSCHYAEVGELGGQLCCWIHEPMFCVWAMKDYGVSESWTMLFSIDNRRIRSISVSGYDVSPIALYECQNGRKVVTLACSYGFYGTLYWYDIDNGDLKCIKRKLG